ncbi:MAG: hemolysin III family protein [Clostridia bacterium]|nr:hemolysin III family protein [Clostridia bacterium]
MQRTKLKDRILPTYTKGEEIFNMTSHIVGAVLGVVATVLCIVFAAVHGNGYGVISGAIYGVTMIVLYTMSSIYHGLSPKFNSKKVFQVLDHCSIFLLIAGSYTPFALCAIRSIDNVAGWSIFGVIWGLAILGIILNSIDIKKFKTFSMICYLLMGWCIIIKGSLLPKALTFNGLILLVAGGIAYTIGAIIYGLGKKHKYSHSIFHLFILLGSFLQFMCILLYVM